MKPFTDWNDANNDRLRAMVAEGLSSTQIAERLGTSPQAITKRRNLLQIPGFAGPPNSWTEERETVLKTMFTEGYSATQIAKKLGGGLTRNAVIGKLARLGIKRTPLGRETSIQLGAGRRPKAPPVKRETPQRLSRLTPPKPIIPKGASFVLGPNAGLEPKPPTPIRERHEEPGSATVMTLGAHMCKWPIGDPASDAFTFCGARKTGTAYCESHARIAYQPQSTNKRGSVSELARGLRRYA